MGMSIDMSVHMGTDMHTDMGSGMHTDTCMEYGHVFSSTFDKGLCNTPIDDFRFSNLAIYLASGV